MTIQDQIDEITVQMAALQRKLNFLTADSGAVKTFVDALVSSSAPGNDVKPIEAAAIIVQWTKFKADGTLPGV